MATAKKARTTTSKKKAAASEVSGEVAKVTTQAVNIEDVIRVRAYQLFEERGYQHGRDFEDWLRAESEVLTRFGVQHNA